MVALHRQQRIGASVTFSFRLKMSPDTVRSSATAGSTTTPSLSTTSGSMFCTSTGCSSTQWQKQLRCYACLHEVRYTTFGPWDMSKSWVGEQGGDM